MKAYLVKNDEFKTVGFQIETNEGLSLYSWGISHNSPFYYTKEVDAEKYIYTAMQLAKVQKELDIYDYRFVSEWFRIAQDGKYLKKGVTGVNFSYTEEIVRQCNAEIERLISTIK